MREMPAEYESASISVLSSYNVLGTALRLSCKTSAQINLPEAGITTILNHKRENKIIYKLSQVKPKPTYFHPRAKSHSKKHKTFCVFSW
jgi:glutamate 5-kinase